MGARWRATNASPERRGAIAVMTAMFIVVIMLVAAVSVDASRIFVARNELQTAADAAALAGAVQLLDDSSTAVDTALAYALLNRVDNELIDSITITRGVWLAASDTFIAGGDPADAIRVTTRHNLPLSIAGFLGDSTISVSSAAIAWSSAPVSDSRCATPLALPYGQLLDVLGYPSWSDTDLTEDDIRWLRENGSRDTVYFHYGHRQQDSADTDVDDDDEYFPVDIDSTWRRDDPLKHGRPEIPGNDFSSYVSGARCSRRVIPGDTLRSEPGNKAPAVRDGLSELCAARGGEFNGTHCLEDGQVVGIPLKIIFWDGVPDWQSNARALLRVRMLGSFVVTEVADPESTDPNSRAKLSGYFNVRRDFGTISAGATPLLRPMLVR